MEFVEQKRDQVLVRLSTLEAAHLLDVLCEVTAQWDLLDTVPLSPSFEQVNDLCNAMSAVVEGAVPPQGGTG